MADPSSADNFFRDWTSDARGNRILAGLTKEETAEYLALHSRVKPGAVGERLSQAESRRYLELHDKHEVARIQAVAAEAELRQKPTIN